MTTLDTRKGRVTMKKLLRTLLILGLAGCGSVAAADIGEDGGKGGDGGTEPDVAAECDFESCLTYEDGTKSCLMWAEFPVNPGRTEVTICHRASPQYTEGWPGHPYAQKTCQRYIAPYYEGTGTGFTTCSELTTSITVHR